MKEALSILDIDSRDLDEAAVTLDGAQRRKEVKLTPISDDATKYLAGLREAAQLLILGLDEVDRLIANNEIRAPRNDRELERILNRMNVAGILPMVMGPRGKA